MIRSNAWHLLIVDEHEADSTLIAHALEGLFLSVKILPYGEDLLAYRGGIDLLLIDLTSPSFSALKWIKSVREKEEKEGLASLPIIAMSGSHDVKVLIELIRLDVLDYLVKPITFAHLEQGIERFTKLMEKRFDHCYRLDATMRYDPKTKTLIEGHVQSALSPKEAQLLEILLENRGRILPRSTLIEMIYHHEAEDVTLRNLIVRLRKKIGKKRIINHKDFGIRLA